MTENELRFFEGKWVEITLVSEAKIKGYLDGVGYEAVRLFRYQAETYDNFRLSHIADIREIDKPKPPKPAGG